MKAYIILGTTGSGVFGIKANLERILNKAIDLKTSDQPNYSSTTFDFKVKNPLEARTLLDKAWDWLMKQDWYKDDKIVSYAVSGLTADDNGEWYCRECGEDIGDCKCKNPEVTRVENLLTKKQWKQKLETVIRLAPADTPDCEIMDNVVKVLYKINREEAYGSQ